jgi:hypothetical protein
MGWKGTRDITRDEALRLCFSTLDTLDQKSNEELGDMLENLGYGDDLRLPYYGYNFNIVERFNQEDEGV